MKHANGEAELNLDLSELGLEDSMIKPEQLLKQEKIGSGGFKEWVVFRTCGSALIRQRLCGEVPGEKSGNIGVQRPLEREYVAAYLGGFELKRIEVDIRELKLLAEFSHPNIVKFVCLACPDEMTTHSGLSEASRSLRILHRSRACS